MSSAAKLRRFGKGTAAVAVAATAMTAFGPAAFASWDDLNLVQQGQVPVADQPFTPAATTTGTIGVVDPTPTVLDNQGATLVQAGKDGQDIGSVRFVIPNRFVSGDIVELRLLDRAATQTNDGSANSGPDYKLGFSADPTVTVSEVQDDNTIVAGDTDDPTQVGVPTNADPQANTETTPDNPWTSTGTAPAITTIKPTVAPSFSVARAQSKGVQGSDIIRLTHTGNPSTGDPDAMWVVTLNGLKVDIGSKITPGALRVVPFAVNKAVSGNSYSNSEWFYTNAQPNSYVGAADPSAVAARQIGIYTVPAYVAPVTMSAPGANIISDGTSQGIGDLTITETSPASITADTYTLTVSGATLQNADGSSITATLVDPETGQTVGAVTKTGPNTLSFTVTGGDNTKISSYKLTGIQLATSTPGAVRFTLAGGSVDEYLATAGTGGAIAGTPILAESTFSGGVAANQDDILAPASGSQVVGTASAGTVAIGGNNRYETARKIAKEWSPLGDEAIIASGENYPDALSSGFLSQRLGAPIILTMKDSVPADTMESLRERGVRKVYLIGGEAAISKAVSDKLLATPAYMWSDSSKNLVPRGGNLEVVRLGGSSRYSTNALVNMYAAAQNTGTAVVGTTSPAYGSANKTTAMIARGDNFADALTANVLTSGRNTGRFTAVGSTGSPTLASTTGLVPSATTLTSLGAGTYVVKVGDPDAGGPLAADPDGAGPALATSNALYRDADGDLATVTDLTYVAYAPTNDIVFNKVGGGVIQLAQADGATAAVPGDSFVITQANAPGYVPQLENLNALPVILTPKGELGDQAKNELSTLHIEHALIIGGADVIPDAVVKSVDGMNITTRRLAGTDRYDTARVVNQYAWTGATASATNTTPGLGFDGGVTTVNGTPYGQAEVFLANGTRFPDALVAGPWVSRRHDAMVLVLQNSIPDPTKKFLTDNAAALDRAIGLGLGAAVSSTVVAEANRLVSSK